MVSTSRGLSVCPIWSIYPLVFTNYISIFIISVYRLELHPHLLGGAVELYVKVKPKLPHNLGLIVILGFICIIILTDLLTRNVSVVLGLCHIYMQSYLLFMTFFCFKKTIRLSKHRPH